MNAVRLAVAGLLVLGLTVLAGAQEKGAKGSIKDRLVGTWEVVKGKGLPVGARVEFTRDGKMAMTFKDREGKVHNAKATYTVEGKAFKMTMKRGDEERTQTIKITKVTDKELVTASSSGETLTLKRVAKSTEKPKEAKKD
jgi:uncharacterized protein (TIGR03066 family)